MNIRRIILLYISIQDVAAVFISDIFHYEWCMLEKTSYREKGHFKQMPFLRKANK